MATQAYYDWVSAGRPWRKATPVVEYQAAFIRAGWPLTSLGTLGDAAHLTADRPQDHTPFSVTGWPDPNPYPYVLAFDAGHLPDQGFDMAPVAARWLQDAGDGKTPWVKYIVWRGQIFDVRRDWAPAGASGHYDHAHVSFRTDWYDKTTAPYAVVGKATPVSSTQTGRDVWSETIDSQSDHYTQPAREFLKWCYTNHLSLDRVEASLHDLSALVAAVPGGGQASIDPQGLADALAANEAFVNVISSTIAARLGMIPTAGEIARAISELRFQVRAD